MIRWFRRTKHIIAHRYKWRRHAEQKSKVHAFLLALVDAGDLTMYSLLYGRL